jgi:DNA mismatch endonuclease (patch repair protein)
MEKSARGDEKSFAISEARRRNMAAIKGKNTQPELKVRRYLHAAGFRYRLHARNLPGRPDIVLPKLRTVVFIHGCFWHHHGCENSVWPKTRAEFWRMKILGNRRRDRMHARRLAKAGWRTLVIWECEVENPQRLNYLRRRLTAAMRTPDKAF